MGLGKPNSDSGDQETGRLASWRSDVPSTATNPAPLVVKIAGGFGLVACLLLIWHFAFAKPNPVAPATATFVTQPQIQPVIQIQPVTPVPVTPQPPTTPVTQPANPVAQPLPPKLIANWKGWPKDAPLPAIAPFNAEQAKQHQEAWAKHLGMPVEYTNSIGMKFRLIPPGEFLMGCTAKELGETIQSVPAAELQTEAPQHKVVLTEAYYLGAHEVTQQQYQAVMNLTPSYFTRTGGGKAAVGDVETSDLPVDSVSWMDAMQFCTKLSEREKLAPFDLRRREIKPNVGNGYRLPTEAQWEFACRAGTQTRYWTGDSDIEVRRAGVFTSRATRKVGQLAANPFGLFDVHGNVWEWCLDGWNPSAYLAFRDEIAVDPLTPWNLGSNRVVGRGAHFYYGPGNGRSARRGNAPQTLRYLDNGFRAALSVEAMKAALANPVQAEAPPVVNDAKEPLTLKGHTDLIHGVAFSPDGKLLASASWDKTVKVWDATSGQETRTIKSPFGQSMNVAFSPNGKRLAVATPNKVQIWGLMSDQDPLTLEGRSGGNSVAFSPDGKRLAVGNADKTVKLWDSLSGQEIRTFSGHTAMVSSVAFSPDGKLLASAGGYNGLREPVEVKLWDVTSGKETLTLKGHVGGVNSIAFAPDGKRLASAGDKEVKVWDTNNGQETLTFKGFAQCHCITFNPDGTRLASAHGDHSVKVWDATTGQELLSSKGHLGAVRSVAFSPDGKRLASGSVDQTVNVWDASKALPEREGDQVLFTFKGHTFPVTSVAYFPDGKRLASAGWDQAVRVWDASNGQELLTLKGELRMFNSVTISPDGKRLAAASDDNQPVTVWDATNGQVQLEVKLPAGPVRSVVFSPDGKRIAAAGHDQTVKVWDAKNGQELFALKRHSGQVTCVTFSPDGSRLASGSIDKSVKVWDATSGVEQRTFAGHPEIIWAIAFSPDGKHLAAGTSQSTVTVWDVANGRQVFALKGEGQWAQSLAYSPDGTRLAVGHAQSQLRVWDLRGTPKPLLLRGHAGQVSGLAFSPDGKWLASASSDKTVKIRDVTPQPGVVGNEALPQASVIARQKEAEGDRHREQKEYPQAIACYREVIQHEPNNAAMLNRLAWLLAVSPAKDQPADEALKFAQRASQEQPNNGFYRNTLGAAQFRSGQFAEALRNLVAVADAPPKSFGWLTHNLFFQALCHEKRGDRPSAQAAYGKALELLKNANGDTSRWNEARLLQKEVASLIVEK